MPKIRIPDYMKPNYEVTINGKPYSYPAGTVQDVPQPVYDAILHYYALNPKEDPPETDEEMIRRICAEMIAEAKSPEIVWDLSEIEFGENDVDVTSVISKEAFRRATIDEYKTPRTAVFTYSGETYSTPLYFCDSSDIHFIAFKEGDSSVPDGIFDLWISLTGDIVYASLTCASLTPEES